MILNVSLGDALDKLSILEIKRSRITDSNKLEEINKEISTLSTVPITNTLLYDLLIYINTIIWDLTDMVKLKTENDIEYAKLARSIFDYNQQRFRIKNMINCSDPESLKEQKSYIQTKALLEVTSFASAIPAIYALSLLYDQVVINDNGHIELHNLFTTPNFIYSKDMPVATCYLDTFLPASDISRYTPRPLRYLSGGRLGDFIHQLSVVYEKYLQTGRKGVIYMCELQQGGDVFSMGILHTFDDIKYIITNLSYVEGLEIYTNQVYDYNLSLWRLTPDLYSKSWRQIFGDMYDVPWASHAWLTSHIRSDLADATLICSSPNRWNHGFDWKRFIPSLPGRVFYLRVSPSEYDHFQRESGINLPYIDAPTFTELVIAINSCQKFVGTLSMPLAVADALKKDRIAITQAGSPDESVSVLNDSRYVNHA